MGKFSGRQIRIATEDDEGAVTKLLRQIWWANGQPEPEQAEPTDDYLRRIVNGCTIFLVEQDGQVVGMNAIRVLDATGHEGATFQKAAFIMAIGVDETKRRQGFGAALVDHMSHWAETEKIDMVSLNVAARNEAARAFYDRMGFDVWSLQMGRKKRSAIKTNYHPDFLRMDDIFLTQVAAIALVPPNGWVLAMLAAEPLRVAPVPAEATLWPALRATAS
ncbi:ribosomal protein S18 acetylase RimI-like enzyme [Rhizobium petrolearium]|uniref:GNAT family N-acetyltransferase n=2 Tax=Neorhizobium TaxID=1525371 RepID=A0ABV0MCN0_9HYPH|nr:GNAT family N-acetyltransferase [Neorhizobium petrolearium]MBP1848320.1 ribosomal protein S18 acetylase RimI-like enzyme [Neorhizobium petrolearium]MCC2614540.1 GNAT family N-acetyltransferase [Neorhizobium petrolearium]WGI72299.1 GNAT family N-acetyltransferase [Neorhizobium petrolearium]